MSTNGWPDRFAHALVLVASLGVATPALAQEMNRRAFPVGEDAVGLGGAYTGRALDASATFYNPGGLPFGRSGSVSIGISLNLISEYDLHGGIVDDTALEYEDAFGVPLFAGGAFSVGGDADGAERHAFAAATLSPNVDNRRFGLASTEAGNSDVLRIQRRDRTRWYGISYAYRPVEWLGIGVSGFLAIRELIHRESQVRFDGSLFARSSEIDLDAELLIFRVGALIRPVPQLSFGVTFQPPVIVVGARASIVGTRADPTTEEVVAEDVGASSPLPWQIRAGLAWEPEPWLLLTLDGVLDGPLGSRGDPIRRVNRAGDSSLLGIHVANEYWTDYTADVAAGARFVIERAVPVALGVFTSLSAAPPVEDTGVYRPDRIDVFGASLSVGFIDDIIDVNVGLMGSLGFGSGLSAGASAGLGPPSYEVVDVRSRTLFLFVSGAGSLVEAIGRRAANEVIGESEGDEASDDP